MANLGLEVMLLHLHDVVETKRRQLELVCKEYKTLLKPWPRRNNQDFTEEKTTEKTPAASGVEVKVSPEEEANLVLVEKLLGKAQKARDVQKKISESKRSGDKGPVQKQNRFPLCKDIDSVQTYGNGEKVSSDIIFSETLANTDYRSDERSTHKSGERSTHDLGNEQNLEADSVQQTKILSTKDEKSVTKNKKSQRETKEKTASCVASVLPSSRKSCTVNVKSIASGGHGEVKTLRPSSSRGSKKYAAHISAPFRTDPNIKVPKKLVTKSAFGSRTVSSKSGIHSAQSRNASKSADIKHAAASGKLSKLKQDGEELKKVQVNKKAENLRTKGEQFDVFSGHEEDQKQEILSFGQSLIRRTREFECDLSVESNISHVTDTLTGEIANRSVTNQGQISKSKLNCNMEKPFRLLEDGSKIPVPSKLCQLYAKNNRLRQRVQTLQMTRKVGIQAAGQMFVDKFEKLFDPSEELLVQRRLLCCATAHKKLLKLLRNLKLDCITELSSPSEVLRAKMMTEFILSVCDDIQQETDFLLTAVIQSEPNHCIPRIYHEEKMSVSKWLPSCFWKGSEVHPPEAMSYQSGSDLQRYQHFTFQVQYQQLQHIILTSVRTQLSPLLYKIDPSSREYVRVFRGINALLTSEGQHQPALVTDSLAQLEETVTSDVTENASSL